MYSCKLTYSIGEIAELMDNEPEEVRDALIAAGVRMMLGGADADLSRWPARRVQRQLDGSIVLLDIELVPSPDEVIVLVDNLPQSWQSRLREARMAQMLSAQAMPEYQRDEAGVDAGFKRLDDANATLAMMTEALANAPRTGDVGKIREAQAGVDIARWDVERAQIGLERLRGDDGSSPSAQEHYADQQDQTGKKVVRRNRPINALTAVIELARQNAVGDHWTGVWAAFVTLAQRTDRPAPLLGYTEGEGVKYQTDNFEKPDGWIKREAFRNRLNRKKL